MACVMCGWWLERSLQSLCLDVATVVLQHPFMKHKNATDRTAICDLIMESKAEVVEVVEDLTEEEDIKEIEVSSDAHRWHTLSPLYVCV